MSEENLFNKILNVVTSIDGQKGIFYTVLVATILLIFEFVFFYKIIVPRIKNEVDDNLSKVAKLFTMSIKKNIQEKTKNIVNHMNVNNANSTDNAYKTDINEDKSFLLNVKKYILKMMPSELKSKIISNNKSLKSNIKSYEKNAISDFKLIESSIDELLNNNDKLEYVLETLNTRNNTLTNKINKYTIATCIIIFLILIIILIIIYNNLKNESLSASVYSAIFTVLILIFFQILFYFLGIEYCYPGSKGYEQFLSIIFDAIKK
jgi:hypothetical protein